MLWNPVTCICPECHKSHVRNEGSVSIYAPKKPEPKVVCSECRERKLDEEILKERLAAQEAAAELCDGYGPIVAKLLLNAELEVIREKLVGKTRLPDYWRSVRRKLEDKE